VGSAPDLGARSTRPVCETSAASPSPSA